MELRRLLPRNKQGKVDEELKSMKLALEGEGASEGKGWGEVGELWRDRVERRRALLAVGAVVLQVASGASYIISLSPFPASPFTLLLPCRLSSKKEADHNENE